MHTFCTKSVWNKEAMDGPSRLLLPEALAATSHATTIVQRSYWESLIPTIYKGVVLFLWPKNDILTRRHAPLMHPTKNTMTMQSLSRLRIVWMCQLRYDYEWQRRERHNTTATDFYHEKNEELRTLPGTQWGQHLLPTPLLLHIAYIVYKKKKQMRRTYYQYPVTIDKHPLLGAKRESYAIAQHILTTYNVTYWYYRITWYQVEVENWSCTASELMASWQFTSDKQCRVHTYIYIEGVMKERTPNLG